MSKLKNALFLTHHIRLCEHHAIDELGISEEELMLRAAKAAFHTLQMLYSDVQSIAIFCGGGNNAGDGYVLATLAYEQGYTVVLYPIKPMHDLPDPAKQAALQTQTLGIPCRSLEDGLDEDVEVVVDALLGIGIRGAVHDVIAQAIHLINESGLPVLALDVPSGLDGDTGQILGVCVQAAVTTTFIAEKVGMYTLDGPDQCGKIVVHRLQLDAYLATLQPAAYRLEKQVVQGLVALRRKNSHKGLFGHVLIVGGGPGMPGASYLAASAALRVGAGMVTIATWPEHSGNVLPSLPEAMLYGIDDPDSLKPLLEKSTVCVIGPGLGESEWAQSLFSVVLGVQLPLVIDASALRLLAGHPQHDDHWILTPHPGEAACLLGCEIVDIQKDRCLSARLIQEQYGGSIVLKGVGSIVRTCESETHVCTAGNPGMASAGMGDVLSGILGGLLAQGVSLSNAAKLGVWIHAQAGDDAAAAQGERGLLATDLMPYLRRQINKCI